MSNQNNELVKVPYYNGHIWVLPHDEMGSEVIEYGVYEHLTTELVRAFVKNDFIFVDIGANIGLHTIAAADSLGYLEEQRIFAFEPAPDIFNLLKKNIRSNGFKTIRAENIALGEVEKVVPFYLEVNKRNIGMNKIVLDTSRGYDLHCEMKTLNSLFMNSLPSDLSSVLIKLDVEGYELFVLKGGGAWLSQVKDCAIIYEVCPSQYEEYGYKPADLLNFLNEHGFREHFLIDDFACRLRKIPGLHVPRYLYNVLSIKNEASYKVVECFYKARSDIKCEAHQKKYKLACKEQWNENGFCEVIPLEKTPSWR